MQRMSSFAIVRRASIEATGPWHPMRAACCGELPDAPDSDAMSPGTRRVLHRGDPFRRTPLRGSDVLLPNQDARRSLVDIPQWLPPSARTRAGGVRDYISLPRTKGLARAIVEHVAALPEYFPRAPARAQGCFPPRRIRDRLRARLPEYSGRPPSRQAKPAEPPSCSALPAGSPRSSTHGDSSPRLSGDPG